MTTFVLVACVKSKSTRLQPARMLYTSPLFRLCRDYAKVVGDRWYILSAKYGLVHPDTGILPYQCTLKTMTSAERKRWADGVNTTLSTLVTPGDRVVLLAGKPYREHLVPFLEGRGCLVSVPMQGLSIGYQLQWPKRAKKIGFKTEDGR